MPYKVSPSVLHYSIQQVKTVNEYKNNTYIYTELISQIFIKLPLLNTDSAIPVLLKIIGKMQSSRQTYKSRSTVSRREAQTRSTIRRLESGPATLMSNRSRGTNDEEAE